MPSRQRSAGFIFPDGFSGGHGSPEKFADDLSRCLRRRRRNLEKLDRRIEKRSERRQIYSLSVEEVLAVGAFVGRWIQEPGKEVA